MKIVYLDHDIPRLVEQVLAERGFAGGNPTKIKERVDLISRSFAEVGDWPHAVYHDLELRKVQAYRRESPELRSVDSAQELDLDERRSVMWERMSIFAHENGFLNIPFGLARAVEYRRIVAELEARVAELGAKILELEEMSRSRCPQTGETFDT